MKRFTATDKWSDSWFRKLKPATKFLWLFLLDNCDNAGIIELDFEIASFHIGQSVDELNLTELGNRIYRLPSGKLLIWKFIDFQYGELNPESNLHKSVIKLVKRHFSKEVMPSGWHVNGISIPLECHPVASECHKVKVQVKVKAPKGGEGGYHKDTRTVLHLLNEMAGHHQREVDSNLKLISARLSEPEVTLDGVKLMLARQVKKWKGTKFEDYLIIKTLFNATNFDGYYAAKDQQIYENNDRANNQRIDRNIGTANEHIDREAKYARVRANKKLAEAGTTQPASGAPD